MNIIQEDSMIFKLSLVEITPIFILLSKLHIIFQYSLENHKTIAHQSNYPIITFKINKSIKIIFKWNKKSKKMEYKYNWKFRMIIIFKIITIPNKLINLLNKIVNSQYSIQINYQLFPKKIKLYFNSFPINKINKLSIKLLIKYKKERK